MMKSKIALLCLPFLFTAVNLYAEVDKAKVAAATGIAAATFLLITLLVAVFYVYSAICLQLIAKKTNQGPLWLAWIPIANLFLMCKIASLKYVWLLGYLFTFIPFVGWIFNLALTGYIWYKIAIARKKPEWLGLLVVLPIVNLAAMGYLAFSEQENHLQS